MGKIGLDINTFYQLTPGEFAALYRKWNDEENNKYQTSWEQTRTAAYFSVWPYLKNKISEQKFMPLPWDKSRKGKAKKVKRNDPKRQEKLRKRYGDQIPVHI